MSLLNTRTLSMMAFGKKMKQLRKIRSEGNYGWFNYNYSAQPEVNINHSDIYIYITLFMYYTQEHILEVPKQVHNKLLHLWKFVQPDLVITLTGIILYGLIGATYPIIGTITADINFVCPLHLLLKG